MNNKKATIRNFFFMCITIQDGLFSAGSQQPHSPNTMIDGVADVDRAILVQADAVWAVKLSLGCRPAISTTAALLGSATRDRHSRCSRTKT